MYNPEPGNKVESLDTPAVLVDLDLMEANLARMMAGLKERKIAARPHLKTVKSPHLARKFLEAGAIGGCVAKIGEAEIMARAGIEDLLITTEIVGPVKVKRLVELVKAFPMVKTVVDSLEGATGLNEGMKEGGGGNPLEILIDLNVGQNRTGILPGPKVLELAGEIKNLKYLKLVGLQGYEGHLQHLRNQEERENRCREAMGKLAEMAGQLKETGFEIKIVSTGGTGTAWECARNEAITEVQPGSFIFMDLDYRNALGRGFNNALTILSTVVSQPEENRVVIDAGLKSLSTDSGMAEPKGFPAMTYRPGGDEHGILVWPAGTPGLKIGDRVEMIPSHIDTTINLHDFYYGIRRGSIETIWPIATRGKVQ